MFLRRWIWGEEPQEPEVKKIEKPKPQPAVKWVSDGVGGYVKATHASVAKQLIRNTQSVSSPQLPTTQTPNATPMLGRNLSDENSTTDEPVADALLDYQVELTKTAKELQDNLTKWKQLKEDVIGNDDILRMYKPEKNNTAGKNVLGGVGDFFNHLWEKIKAALEPANLELHDLLENTHSDVQVLCDHLAADALELKKTDSDEQCRKLKVDMCNTSIAIIEDLITFVDNIQRELQYCLRCEMVTEKMAVHLAQLAVLIVTKIPLPDFDFNLSGSYRNFLYNEIGEEKKAIDIFETDVKGTLAKALRTIKERPFNAKTADQQKPEETITNGVQSNVTLFTTPKMTGDENNQIAVEHLAKNRMSNL